MPAKQNRGNKKAPRVPTPDEILASVDSISELTPQQRQILEDAGYNFDDGDEDLDEDNEELPFETLAAMFHEQGYEGEITPEIAELLLAQAAGEGEGEGEEGAEMTVTPADVWNLLLKEELDMEQLEQLYAGGVVTREEMAPFFALAEGEGEEFGEGELSQDELDMLLAGQGEEGELSEEDFAALLANLQGEGEFDDGEGEFDDGEGELSEEELAMLLENMGEGEFDYGEGEFDDGEGELSEDQLAMLLESMGEGDYDEDEDDDIDTANMDDSAYDQLLHKLARDDTSAKIEQQEKLAATKLFEKATELQRTIAKTQRRGAKNQHLSKEDKKNLREQYISARAAPHPNGGVIYLGHLPTQFTEDVVHRFFKQFGVIKKVRLSRNAVTGKYRGYGFVEFESPEIAAIVADAMNGYMVFDKTIVCHYVPYEQLHEQTFRNHFRPFKRIPVQKRHQEIVNAPRTEQQIATKSKQLQSRSTKQQSKWEKLGFDYSFPGYSNTPFDVLSQAEKDAAALGSKKTKGKKAAAAPVVVEEPVVAPKKGKKAAAAPVVVEEPVVAKKGKKAAPVAAPVVVEEPVVAKKGKKAAAPVAAPVVVEEPVAKKGKKAAAPVAPVVVEEPVVAKKGKKAVAAPVVVEEPVVVAKKGKKAVEAPVVVEEPVVAPKKGKKAVEAPVVVEEPVVVAKKGKKAAAPVVVEEPVVAPKKGKKAAAAPVVVEEPVVAPKKGKKAAAPVVVEEPVVAPKQVKKAAPAVQEPVKKQAKKSAVEEPVVTKRKAPAADVVPEVKASTKKAKPSNKK